MIYVSHYMYYAALIFDAAAKITDHSFMVMIKIIVILDKMLALLIVIIKWPKGS